jgi:hypothetical protein
VTVQMGRIKNAVSTLLVVNQRKAPLIISIHTPTMHLRPLISHKSLFDGAVGVERGPRGGF